ncbi:uncharacterized protein LOC144172577 [Haemaphysalis longicornis]
MDKVRRHRGAVRAAITKGIATIESLLLDPATPAVAFQGPLNLVNMRYEEMKALDQKIKEGLSEEDFEADLVASWDYDAKVVDIQARVEFATRPADTPHAVAGGSRTGDRPDDASSTSLRQPAVSPVIASTRFAALPKLHIPTFSGDRRSWQAFWDHFDATIHSNPALAHIEKFKYLTSYLTGKAKAAIEGIRLAEANYDVAIGTLTARFGRTDLLVEDHIDSFLALAPVRSSSEVGKLRDLYDQISFRVNALRSLGVAATEYAVVLHRVLMKALPPDLGILYRQRAKEASSSDGAASSSGSARQVSERASSSERAKQVDEILDFLRIQVEVREEGHFDLPRVLERRPHEKREATTSDSGLPSAAALPAGASLPPTRAEPRSEQSQRQCPLCAADHRIAECTVPMSPQEKRRELRTGGRCFRCGTKRHFARCCRLSRSLVCVRCSKGHLTVLCDIAHPPQATANGRARMAGGGQATAPNDGQATPSVTSASSGDCSAARIYLQTGRAWAIGASHKLIVRILLDSGSQRTFIRRDLSRTLRCPVRGVEDLSLVTFGDSRPRSSVRCNGVAITLKSQHGGRRITIEALEVPEICAVTSPPVNAEVLSKMAGRNLTAADGRLTDTHMEDRVSILIGSDSYWKVSSGRISRLTPHLTAAETIFGWTVQGADLDNGSHGASEPSCAMFIAHADPSGSNSDEEMDPSDLWRLEAIGIKETPEGPGLDAEATKQFEREIRKQDGRYEVPLLIQEPGLEAHQDNYALAEQRLRMQLRRFRSRPDLLSQYDKTIRDYFNEGHAERVPTQETRGTPNTYYMPHHGVVRQDAVTIQSSSTPRRTHRAILH